MYSALITAHSLVRWLVLASLLLAIYRGYRGWLTNQSFSRFDNTVRHTTATMAHIQLVIGLWLYAVSPLVDFFFNQYEDAVRQRGTRFFGMEHSVMMVIAITIITIGSMLAKRRPTAQAKFKTMAIWFSIGLLIILFIIPWPFSPLASRPYFRAF